jgi:hypothetical protein
MVISTTLRNILEIGFGVLYLIGGVFNTVYTFRHGEQFFGSFAEGAWFSPARWFIRKFVIPNPRIFTITLILFQLLVAIMLISQGPFVALGLLAGTVFCMYAVFVSNVPGAIVNLGLALIQFYLASSK